MYIGETRHALTVTTGQIGGPGDVDEYTLDLMQGPEHGVYSIQVLDYRDDGLDPDAVEILDAHGDPVPVRQRVADANANGASASAVVVQLAPGQYRIRVRSQNDTTGRYRLDVRMPGVLDQEGIVHDRSVRQAEAAMLQQHFGFSAIAQELFGHKLGFDLATDQFRPEFDANLNGHIDPMDMDAIMANHDSEIPIRAQAALTPVAGGSGEAMEAEAESIEAFQLGDLSFSVFQNPETPADVDANGLVMPLDVLLLVNKVNADGTGPVDAIIGDGDSTTGEGEVDAVISPPFYDVSGDYVISPLDVT